MERKFKLEVLIYRRPNLRDSSVEMEMYMGRNILDNLFDTMKVDEVVTSCYFSFPETWLNIVEQRSLLSRIEKYYPNVKHVKIKTHSVYIIQMTGKGESFIVSGVQEEREPLPAEGDEGHLYTQMVGGLFPSDGKLTILN
jgi:hypothetical protein